MPNGQVVISNEGCANGGKLEQVTTSAPVTYDRWRQAAEVNARANNQLNGIEREKAAFNDQLRRQQAAQVVIDQQHAVQQARNDAMDSHRRCLEEASRYRGSEQARRIAACNGTTYVEPEMRQAAAPSLKLKNCEGNICKDENGTKYKVNGGTVTRRSDDQRCQRNGSYVQCD